MTKNPNPSLKRTTGRSNSKPIAIVVLGVFAAVAIAAFLSQGGAEETSVGSVNLQASDEAQENSLRVKGPEDAVVTLVEFGDFQCPTCGVFHPVVNELLDRFPNQLQLEFHHFPLISIHPNALAAAVAAESAAEQDAFWEMYDLLFELQTQWSSHPSPEQQFITYAERLGLDREQFEAAYQSGRPQARVLADLERAEQMQLQGTPTFFVNDQMLPLPRTFGEFENAIASAITDTE